MAASGSTSAEERPAHDDVALAGAWATRVWPEHGPRERRSCSQPTLAHQAGCAGRRQRMLAAERRRCRTRALHDPQAAAQACGEHRPAPSSCSAFVACWRSRDAASSSCGHCGGHSSGSSDRSSMNCNLHARVPRVGLLSPLGIPKTPACESVGPRRSSSQRMGRGACTTPTCAVHSHKQ
eukprot:3730336-Prymnesium_polylepis.1